MFFSSRSLSLSLSFCTIFFFKNNIMMIIGGKRARKSVSERANEREMEERERKIENKVLCAELFPYAEWKNTLWQMEFFSFWKPKLTSQLSTELASRRSRKIWSVCNIHTYIKSFYIPHTFLWKIFLLLLPSPLVPSRKYIYIYIVIYISHIWKEQEREREGFFSFRKYIGKEGKKSEGKNFHFNV